MANRLPAYCWNCRTQRIRNATRPQSAMGLAMRPPAPMGMTADGGITSHGMINSFNNKQGFGYIMLAGDEVHYRREHVSSKLLHPDHMPGTSVTFELYRDGWKLIAKNVRKLNEDLSVAMVDGFGRYNSTLKNKYPMVEQNPTEEKWQCQE